MTTRRSANVAENIMGIRINQLTRCIGSLGWVAAVALSVAIPAQPAGAADAARYDTPEAAVNALLEASKAKDREAIVRIFGDGIKEILSGDEVDDRNDLERFARRLAQSRALVKEEDGTMTLNIGADAWPFPFPLALEDGKWFFDVEAGKDEILSRRIGENELGAIGVCRGYVEAQREYYAQDRDGDGVLEFAQRIASTPGKKDGLFWEVTGDEPPSPLGPLVADAREEGYVKKDAPQTAGPQPFHGYIYKMLTRQGEKAPGGKYDYIINGHMLAGFALVAYPVDHGASGIMTFVVNQNGKVYQKDLGEDTAKLAREMTEFNPDESWTITTDE